MKGFMIKRLQDELGLSEEAARWAVETWADALGLSEKPEESLAGSPAVAPRQEARKIRPSPDPALLEKWTLDLGSGAILPALSAIEGLGQYGDPASISLLIRALSGNHWRIRNAAYDALVRLSPESVPALIRTLDDPDEALVSRIVFILAAIRDRNATEPLLTLLGRSPGLDKSLIFALGEIGDLRAASALSKCLVSLDSEISLAAAGALQKISGSKPAR
jgi:HEAT repeat protein